MKEHLTLTELALFIGCYVVVNNEVYKNKIVRLTEVKVSSDICVGDGMNWRPKHCMPILRPMSSMTPKEGRKWARLKEEAWHPKNVGNVYAWAECFKWAMFKHFDVFGWIEKEFAFSKEDITQSVISRLDAK
jgi:hypothetical protein